MVKKGKARDVKQAQQHLAVSQERKQVSQRRVLMELVRGKDIEYLEAQVQRAVEEGKKIDADFKDFAASTAEKIQKLLKDAGIFDQVADLEKARGDFFAECRKKVDALQAQVNDWNKTIAFLRERENEATENAAVAAEQAQEAASSTEDAAPVAE